MSEQIKRYDILKAQIPGMECEDFLVIDGEKSLKKQLPIISIPLLKEKSSRFHLYVDCPVEGEIYLAAMDGIQQIPRESLMNGAAIRSLTDEKAKVTIEDTFKVMLNM